MMNKIAFTFFTKELSKIAGVELNLRGYSADPTVTDEMYARSRDIDNMEKYQDAYSEAIKTKSPKWADYNKEPGFFGSLLGKKSTFDREGFDASRKAHNQDVTRVESLLAKRGLERPIYDESEHARRLRSDNKHQDKTHGKLTARMFNNSQELEGLDTDQAYSMLSRSNYLDDKKLDKIVGMYKQKMTNFGDADYSEGHKRFLSRADALRKDPNIKGYRLEWG